MCPASSRWRRSQRLFDRRAQPFLVDFGRRDFLTVLLKNRRPMHAKRYPPFLFRHNSLRYVRAAHVGLESFEIEPELGRVIIEVRANIICHRPDAAISVKGVVHFPKLPLQSGGLGGPRCVQRKTMHLQRMLAENHDETLVVVVLQFFEDRPDDRTRQTLEIAKLFQDRGRARLAANVHRFGAGLAIIENWARGRRNRRRRGGGRDKCYRGSGRDGDGRHRGRSRTWSGAWSWSRRRCRLRFNSIAI